MKFLHLAPVAPAIAALILALIAASQGEELLEELRADSECESPEVCAFSALQLRTKGKEELPENTTETESEENYGPNWWDAPKVQPDEVMSLGASGLGQSQAPIPYTGQRTVTLYHQTSPAACRGILQTGFRLGSGGWCGNAIYFAKTPEATRTKAIAPTSQVGCMLEVTVVMSRVLQWKDVGCGAGWKAFVNWTDQSLRDYGYDSIIMKRADGPEYIIFDNKWIINKRVIPFQQIWKAHPMKR